MVKGKKVTRAMKKQKEEEAKASAAAQKAQGSDTESEAEEVKAPKKAEVTKDAKVAETKEAKADEAKAETSNEAKEDAKKSAGEEAKKPDDSSKEEAGKDGESKEEAKSGANAVPPNVQYLYQGDASMKSMQKFIEMGQTNLSQKKDKDGEEAKATDEKASGMGSFDISVQPPMFNPMYAMQYGPPMAMYMPMPGMPVNPYLATAQKKQHEAYLKMQKEKNEKEGDSKKEKKAPGKKQSPKPKKKSAAKAVEKKDEKDMTPEELEKAQQTKKAIKYTISQNSRNKFIFEQRLEELTKFKEKFGHANPPQSFSTGLYRWCHRKRTSKRDGLLPDYQEEALTKLGFEFNNKSYSSVTFETRIEQLLAFKKEFGHLKVNSSYNSSLHSWCSHARSSLKAYKQGKSPHIRFEPDQIMKLQEIGFDEENDARLPIVVDTANCEAKKRIAFTSTLDDLKVETKNKKKRKGGKSAMGKDDDLLLAVTFASKKKKGKTKASS